MSDSTDLGKARERARRVRGFKDSHGRPLPLHDELKALGRGGVGVELFFRTLRWCGIVLLVSTALGIASLVDNARSNRGVVEAGIVSTTVGPSGAKDPSQLRNWHVIPWFVMFLTWICFLYLLRVKQRLIAKLVDRRYVTSGDYAVEVRNIPPGESSEHQLLQFFEQFGRVAQVQIGYTCSEYVKLWKRWKKFDVERTEMRARLAADEATNHAPNSARHSAKVSDIERDMIELEGQMANAQAVALVPTGAAFVIFDTEAGRRACLRAHSRDWWEQIADLCGCGSGPRYRDSFQLQVVPAPEPSDVFWENLEVGPDQVRSAAQRGAARRAWGQVWASRGEHLARGRGR
jgi:hypothetical protein